MKGKFIYVGRLEEIKGIALLMKTWKKMGEEAPELILCGRGPLEDLCRQTSPHVIVKGYVPNPKVRSLIACSDALVLPSQIYEGFPMTILEAFSVGTPVIGSNIGNIDSLIEEGNNGLKFRYDSEEALLRAIKKMCAEPFRVGKEFAEKYSADRNYGLIKDIYDHLN